MDLIIKNVDLALQKVEDQTIYKIFPVMLHKLHHFLGMKPL